MQIQSFIETTPVAVKQLADKLIVISQDNQGLQEQISIEVALIIDELKGFLEHNIFTDKTENVVKQINGLIKTEHFLDEVLNDEPELMVS